MFENITLTHADVLDEILRTRHSVRTFSPTPPDRAEIEQIVRAGLIAPFASIPARGKTDFRKIFVIPSESSAMTTLENIVQKRLLVFLEEIKEEKSMESIRKNYESVTVSRLIGNAPYLVIAGERKGFPPTYMADASISLSYCMYNMWLKAVSLKIGFKLVSLVVHLKLGNDMDFCRLAGIPCTEYAVDACALGYPADTYRPAQVNYPEYEANVTWF